MFGLNPAHSEIINNILEHPGEEKYCKIKIKTRIYQGKLADVDGARELLLTLGNLLYLLSFYASSDNTGFARKVIEYEEYLVVQEPNCDLLTACRDLLNERHVHSLTRAAQAEHNKKRAQKEEEEYQKSIRTRIETAEKDREEVFGINKK